MAHRLHLITLFEYRGEKEHGIRNVPENKRRAKRREDEKTEVEKAGKRVPLLQQTLVRVTQTSVKFLRWLSSHLWRPTSWEAALGALRAIYASL